MMCVLYYTFFMRGFKVKLPPQRVLLRIVVWLFALCIVAVIALHLIVRSEWFLRQARMELERGLNRKVTFSSLSPSLLYGAGICVRDLILFEKDGHTPCLQSETILIKVRILPLLWRSLSLSSISMARPRLSLVRGKDGTWNMEGLLQKEKPAAGETPAGRAGAAKKRATGRFFLSRLRISNGAVTISDPAWSRPVVLKDVDLRAADMAQGVLPYIDGKGRIEGIPLADLARVVKELRCMNLKGGSVSGPVAVTGWLGEKVQFRATLAAEGVRLEYSGRYTTPESGLTMNLEVQGDGSYAEKVWDIRKISAGFFGGRLRASGSLLGLGRNPAARLEISARNLPWESIGTLSIPNLSLDGSSAFSAAIEGTKEDMSMKLDLDLRGSSLVYGARIKKPAGGTAELKIPLRREGTRIRWADAVVRLGGLRLTSEGSLETAGGRALKARFKADECDLKSLSGMLTPGVVAAGRGAVDISLERSLAQPLTSTIISGSAKVAGGEFRFAGLRQPVMYDAACTCAAGNVRLGLSTVRVGSSCGEGYLSFDLKRWPAFDCEFNFPIMDTADFAAASRAQGKASLPRGAPFISGAEAAPAESREEGPFLPPLIMGLEGRGRVAIGELRMGKLKARDGRGKIVLSKGVVSVEEFSLPLYGGESGCTLAAAMSGPEPRYTLDGTATRVDLAALLSDLYGYSDALSGWLSLECAASGEGKRWSSVQKALRAKGRFSVHEGRLRTVGLLKEIAPLFLVLGQEAKCKEFLALGELLKKAPSETRFSRCEGDFIFEGERWGTGNMLLEIAEKPNPMRLLLKGEMGLSGTLNLSGRASFARGTECYQQLEPYFPDDAGWITVPFPIPIGGTLNHPRVDLEAARTGILSCAAEIGALRLRKEVEKKIDRALQPKPKKKGESPTADDVGREMLKGASKELLKQMMKQ